jgi:hypothetical protein
MTDDEQVEKHIPKNRLVALSRAFDAAQSRLADERGELGRKIKEAEDKHHLDKWAFKVAQQLKRMNDSGKQSRRLRALSLYCDMLEVGGQTDLVDLAEEGDREDEEDQRGTRFEDEPDDETTTDVVDELLAGDGTGENAGATDEGFDAGAKEPDLILRTFRNSLEGMVTAKVRRALDAFVKEYPHLAGDAEEIAAKRFAEITAAKPARKARGTIKDESGREHQVQ